MKFWKTSPCLLVASALLLIQQSSLQACGLSYTTPVTHFPGVDSYGNVRYWDKIADIDLGGGLTRPLSIGFASDWSQSSPYLGYGWALPLLDSHIVQKNEYSFEVLQPDGYTRPFMRDAKDPTLLSGGPGWMGKVDADHTITLWASCGWKIIYKEGKIVSMSTPKGKTLTFERDASGAVTEVTEGTLVILKVEQDYPMVKIILENQGGIQGPGGEKTIVLTQVEKPRIEIVDGTNAVAATDWSLGRVVVNGDETQAKSYSYTPTASLQPEITIQNGADAPSRQIVWNTATHFIVSDGEWTYKITPAEQKGYKAAIDRKNAKGGEEFWHQDDAMGQETTLSLDGTKRIETWFTSGALAGKTRKIEEIKNGTSKILKQYAYDENGRMVREIFVDGVVANYKYDKNGKQSVSLYQSPEVLKEKESKLMSAISKADNSTDKDHATMMLAIFYVVQAEDAQKAQQTAKLLKSNIERNKLKQIVIVFDKSLSNSEKIARIKALIQENPEEASRANVGNSLKVLEEENNK